MLKLNLTKFSTIHLQMAKKCDQVDSNFPSFPSRIDGSQIMNCILNTPEIAEHRKVFEHQFGEDENVIQRENKRFVLNFNHYMAGFSGAFNTREAISQRGGEKHQIPPATIYRQWIEEEINRKPILSCFISSMSVVSARSAGAAGALFTWHLISLSNSESGSYPMQSITAISDAYLILHNATIESRAEYIVGYYKFISSKSCERFTYAKAIFASGKKQRIDHKEPCTLMSDMRSLISHLRVIGIVSPGTARNNAPDTKYYWAVISSLIKTSKQCDTGLVTPLKKFSITRRDLVFLLKRVPPTTELATIQSWLAVLMLTAIGCRPGSVHEDKSDRQLERYCQTMDLDYDFHSEDRLSFAFRGLRTSDIEILRTKPLPGDPRGTVRLRACLRLRRGKTTAFSMHECVEIGLCYPTQTGDGKWDWSPNGAIGLALLCLMVGSVKSKYLFVDFSELLSSEKLLEAHNGDTINIMQNDNNIPPQPLFRAATCGRAGSLTAVPSLNFYAIVKRAVESFDLPPHGFSARSFRIGYAETLILNSLRSFSPDEVVSLTTLLNILTTSAAWQSRQALTYIKNLSNSLRRNSVTETAFKARDWGRACFYSSVRARVEGSYSPMSFEEAKLKCSFSKINTTNKIKAYRSCHNLSRWVKATPAEYEYNRDEDITQCALDIRKTVERLLGVMANSGGFTEIPFGQLLGNFYADAIEFRCPVSGCGCIIHGRAPDAEVHLRLYHMETVNSKIRFDCPCGLVAGCSSRALRAHSKSVHKITTDRALSKPSFKFVFFENGTVDNVVGDVKEDDVQPTPVKKRRKKSIEVTVKDTKPKSLSVLNWLSQ